MKTDLKLCDKTVLRFDFEDKYYEVIEPDCLPYSLRNSVKDTTKIYDKELLIETAAENKSRIEEFFRNRTLSVNRENAKIIMNALGIKQNNDTESRIKTMILCKALSVSDCYWLTNNPNEKWNDVNLSVNPLHETLQQIALFGRSLTVTGKIISPEPTSQGAYAKAWYRENGKLYLYKAGTPGGNECEREVLASNILDCFNVPHVKYTLDKFDGRVVCKCENMNLDNTSIVDSLEYDSWASKRGLDFIDESRKLDPDLYYKTIIVDYLIANSDRHEGNWGFFMNNKTGKIIRMHPLFDHNNAFDKEFMNDKTGGICQLMPGKNMKEAALYAIRHCDFRCIKPVTKNMFFSQEMYNTFMTRACELGLYREQKLNIFDKLVSGKEQFVPCVVKPDNSDEYWHSVNKKLKDVSFQTIKKTETHFNPVQLYFESQMKKKLRNEKNPYTCLSEIFSELESNNLYNLKKLREFLIIEKKLSSPEDFDRYFKETFNIQKIKEPPKRSEIISKVNKELSLKKVSDKSDEGRQGI